MEHATRYSSEEIEEMVTDNKFSLYKGQVVAVVAM